MKGIVLAGGAGTRLYPSTISVSKQLLTVYDKPLIFYPISVLMLAGIREILVISTPKDLESYKDLLGGGERYGVNFTYIVQEKPRGLAEAFILGEDFIGNDSASLILGDNIFYGQGFRTKLLQAKDKKSGATIFGYYVNDPERYGVAEIDQSNKVISIEEKPSKPKSNFAVTGLYFYDNEVIEIAKSIQPSARGELEITDVNKRYLENKNLNLEILGRGFAWLDTGTHESLLEASNFIQIIETRQGLKIACLEEIAYRMNYITKDKLYNASISYEGSNYGDYLKKLFLDL